MRRLRLDLFEADPELLPFICGRQLKDALPDSLQPGNSGGSLPRILPDFSKNFIKPATEFPDQQQN